MPENRLVGNRRLHPYENASRMNEQRARENSAYVRKLLSEREPEFAAALAAAERYISWSFRPGGDEDRDDPRCSDSGTVMLLLMAMLRESKRP